jgi:polyisoprenoid-binding protein YceI
MLIRSIFAVLVLNTAGLAMAGSWVFDDAHSAADFSIKHMMVSNVKGQIRGVKGEVDINDTDLSKSHVDVTLDVATISTNNQKRDDHLKSPDFFDSAKFPLIKFVSKKVVKSGAGLSVTGDLTMHGVTKSVVMAVDGPSPVVKDPWGKAKRGFTATTTLNRKEFGISWNKSLDGGGIMLSDDVKITIESELEEKKAK